MKIELMLYHNGYHSHVLPAYCEGVGTGPHALDHNGRYRVEAIDLITVSATGELVIYATPTEDDPNVPRVSPVLVEVNHPIAVPDLDCAPIPAPVDASDFI